MGSGKKKERLAEGKKSEKGNEVADHSKPMVDVLFPPEEKNGKNASEDDNSAPEHLVNLIEEKNFPEKKKKKERKKERNLKKPFTEAWV